MKEKIIKLLDSSSFEDIIVGLELAYKNMSWKEFDDLLYREVDIFKERTAICKVPSVILFIWDNHHLVLDGKDLWRRRDGRQVNQNLFEIKLRKK